MTKEAKQQNEKISKKKNLKREKKGENSG